MLYASKIENGRSSNSLHVISLLVPFILWELQAKYTICIARLENSHKSRHELKFEYIKVNLPKTDVTQAEQVR